MSIWHSLIWRTGLEPAQPLATAFSVPLSTRRTICLSLWDSRQNHIIYGYIHIITNAGSCQYHPFRRQAKDFIWIFRKPPVWALYALRGFLYFFCRGTDPNRLLEKISGKGLPAPERPFAYTPAPRPADPMQSGYFTRMRSARQHTTHKTGLFYAPAGKNHAFPMPPHKDQIKPLKTQRE